MKRKAHRRVRTKARHGAPQLRLGVIGSRELIVDLFAGGGGTSEGMKAATGRDPDIAINHDPLAVAMHEANHPTTKHFCESVFKVSPRHACQGRPVGLLWLSPDCTHFSKSKGGKPRPKKIRGLAWVAVRWAKEVAPRIICLENVEEFEGWGPLLANGLPDPARAGKTFRAFVRKLEGYGYRVEWKLLVAADYGVPTTRKRLFLIARRDGKPIAWPEATHAKDGTGPKRWRPAAQVIDFSLPVRSIFGRKKKLAQPTMWRIAAGLIRHVIGAAEPFIVPVTHHKSPGRTHGIDEPVRTVTGANRGELAFVTPFMTRTDMQSDGRLRGLADLSEPVRTITSTGGHAIVAPTLIHLSNGERPDQSPRIYDIQRPVGTVVAGGVKQGLVAAWLVKHYGGVVGHGVERPIGTITNIDHHALATATLAAPSPDRRGEVRALLAAYIEHEYTRAHRARQARVYGPIPFVAKPAVPEPLVTVDGQVYEIADVGMRMLAPRELFRAQGFPDSYVINPTVKRIVRGMPWVGPLGKTQQIAKAGNAVNPKLAEVLVRANFTERERSAA